MDLIHSTNNMHGVQLGSDLGLVLAIVVTQNCLLMSRSL